MKCALVGVVVFCGSAAADPVLLEDNVPKAPEQAPHPLALEVGAEVGRVDIGFPQAANMPTSRATAEGVHVGVRVNATRYLYAALGVDVSHVSLTGPYVDTGVPGSPVMPGDPGYGTTVALEGTMTKITGAVGARAFAGMFSGGVELGGGMRYYNVRESTTTWGMYAYDAVGVARGRIEFWMTPRLSLAALAEVDLQDAHDMAFAVMFGAHTMAYDAAR